MAIENPDYSIQNALLRAIIAVADAQTPEAKAEAEEARVCAELDWTNHCLELDKKRQD
jgi:hypothetical protein